MSNCLSNTVPPRIFLLGDYSFLDFCTGLFRRGLILGGLIDIFRRGRGIFGEAVGGFTVKCA